MEDIYLTETPPSSPNQASSRSSFDLTRLNSTASSLTIENYKDTLLPSGNASSDQYMGWTNEKHNAFLDGLEASFVKQLQKSIVVHTGSVELNTGCRNLSGKRSSSFRVKTRSHLILSKPAELPKTVCRLTEGSGQNFAGEDSEENRSCKRMKMPLVATVVQEQIVPTLNYGSAGVASCMFQSSDQLNLESSSGNGDRS